MTFYVHVAEDGAAAYPRTLTDLRLLRRDVSFPAQISNDDAAAFGFFPVAPSPEPEGRFQTNERSAELVDGAWVEQWNTVPWTQEQIDAATAAQWDNVRDERNAKLVACDWTQLDDTPLSNTEKQSWAVYRQALRDITDQADPFAITWPAAPGA